MICRCFGHSLDLSALARGTRQTARLMIGLPNYDAYLAHLAASHPGQIPMDTETFFRERQAARYGNGGAPRCC